MLIVCPNCATSYMIDPSALGSGGRTVRFSVISGDRLVERNGEAQIDFCQQLLAHDLCAANRPDGPFKRPRAIALYGQTAYQCRAWAPGDAGAR